MTDVEEQQEPRAMVVTPQMEALKVMIQDLTRQTSEEDFAYDIGRIMDSILSGETPEEVFSRAELGSTATKDYLQKAFVLSEENIQWRKSKQGIIDTGGFPFYALFTVTDLESDEEITLNGGGASFCATLYRLQQLGYWNDYPEGRGFMLVGKTATNGEVVLLRPFATGKRASSAKAK